MTPNSKSTRFQKVFISYAREDARHAERLYMDLRSNEVDAWLDTRCLLPGQNWKREITKVIRESAYFVALISKNSVNKRGVVQTEMKRAFEVLSEVPSHQIFLIPVRLDPTSPADEELQNLNWVDLFPSYKKGLERILAVCRDLPKAPVEWNEGTGSRAPIAYAPYRSFADLAADVLERTARSSAFADTRHSIWLRFSTNFPGVVLTDALKKQYSAEMQIVLQHQFDDLVAGNESFDIVLFFSGVRTKLTIPYEAVIELLMPSVGIRVQNLKHLGVPDRPVVDPMPQQPPVTTKSKKLAKKAVRPQNQPRKPNTSRK
jgi:hypothetical protein